jgi:hypothetical protein
MKSIEKSSDLIGNRTRDHLACNQLRYLVHPQLTIGVTIRTTKILLETKSRDLPVLLNQSSYITMVLQRNLHFSVSYWS